LAAAAAWTLASMAADGGGADTAGAAAAATGAEGVGAAAWSVASRARAPHAVQNCPDS